MKPILFNPTMVRAILDGRKTQTRRVIKLQNPSWSGYFADGGCLCSRDGNGCWKVSAKAQYKLGDMLWVRETWSNSGYNQSGELTFTDYVYKASDVNAGRVWKPSIHMPRTAARIFLRVTDVRCERLNDISNKDAIAEGLKVSEIFAWVSYAHLWDSLNLKRNNGVYAWAKNPWVWVYEFERITKEEAEK